MVVTEIATPTAALARVSTASMPATPAASATPTIAELTVVRSVSDDSPTVKSAGMPLKRSSRAASTSAVRQVTPSPSASVPSPRLARLRRPVTKPTQAAVIGSVSGLTAIAPTISVELS